VKNPSDRLACAAVLRPNGAAVLACSGALEGGHGHTRADGAGKLHGVLAFLDFARAITSG